MNTPINKDDFDYAFASSRVVREPNRFIDTFGLTRFEFLMASELMDSVGKVRVRSGVMEAQKPHIIKPDSYSQVAFEGFSDESREEANKLLSWLESQGADLAFLRYGFEFKKKEAREEIVHDSLANVLGKLEEEADKNANPALAIIEGVDDTWEVALLKFTIQMINRSTEVNISDYKRRGLL